MSTRDDSADQPSSYPHTAVRVARLLRFALRNAALFVLGACSGGGGGADIPAPVTPPAPTVATLTLSPASVQMVVGGRAPLTLIVTDSRGATVTGRAAQWTSTNSAVVVVDDSIGVRGLAVGTATVSATMDSRSGTAAVTVFPAGVTTLRLAPAAATLPIGGAIPFVVTALDTLGGAVAAPVVTWSSSAPAVISVGSDGVARALAAGTAIVTATTNGRTATAMLQVSRPPVGLVTVTAPSQTLAVGTRMRLALVVRDTAGTILTDRLGTWATSAASVASVSADGEVLGLAAGTVTITATVESRAGSATIQVVPAAPAAPATVTITPATATLMVGATASLTAVARDATGTVLAGRTTVWSSSDTTRATVSAIGLVTAHGVGTATIRAAVDGTVGTSALSITAAPSSSGPYTLAISSGNGQTGLVGATLPLPPAVQLRDGSGRGVPGVPVSFVVTAGGGRLSTTSATTNASGVATAGSWTLGALAGTNVVQASAQAPNGTPLVATFTATAITSTPTTPPRVCCRVCTTGKPCGDTCIAANLTCRTSGGCACAAALGVIGPSLDAVATLASVHASHNGQGFSALTLPTPFTTCATRLSALTTELTTGWLLGA